jgi:hypothetical protein
MLRSLAVLLLVLASAPTVASPWLLPKGELALSGSVDFQVSESEFLLEGGQQSFPLDGRFIGASFVLGARLGLTDEFELSGSVPLRLVSFTLDPVILLPQEAGDLRPPAEYYADNVVDFSRAGGGVGDVSLAGRYRVFADPVALALELGLDLPTGYRGPEGTFGPEPARVEDVSPRVRELVRPENVRDDVTVGDARANLMLLVHAGMAFETGTFVRVAGGYRLRFAGAADQIVARLRFGQSLGPSFLLFAGSDFAYATESGVAVGVTANAIDPELPANQYLTTPNIRFVERRLEYDALDVTGGLIWRLADTVELNVSYARTLWGRNTSIVNAVSFGVLSRFELGP